MITIYKSKKSIRKKWISEKKKLYYSRTFLVKFPKIDPNYLELYYANMYFNQKII